MVIFNKNQKPVLIAEIKNDSWARGATAHQTADKQMHQQYNQMLHDCPLAHLYGLSLLGTSLCIYHADMVTGDLTPDFVIHPHPHHVVPCNFLEGQWDLDILSEDGFKKIQEIVAYLKAGTANIRGQ
jgi:hypothetical protein